MYRDWKLTAEELLEEEDDERYCLAYIDGLIAGINMFAWWKDGVEYVGSCGTAKKEIIDEINQWMKDKNVLP